MKVILTMAGRLHGRDRPRQGAAKFADQPAIRLFYRLTPNGASARDFKD
jgi:hypothetical protein